MVPSTFFFFKIVLTMPGPLNFHMNLRISLPSSLGWGDPLEKGKATLSCILAWRVRHNWGAKCLGFPGSSENKASICLPAMRETWVRSLGREDPLEKEMATHPSTLLPEKCRRWRRLLGYSPWDHQELHTTDQLHFLPS